MRGALKGTGTGRRLIVAALLVSTVLAGSAAVHAAGDSPRRSASSTPGDRPAPASEARALTAGEKGVLHAAEQILLRDCMRREGFAYQVTGENPLPEAREFPYVVDDLAWATEHGYGSGLQRRLEEIKRNDPNQRYFRSLSPERRAAALTVANGPRPTGLTARTPDGMVLSRSGQGCQSEAERILYGDLQAWFQARTTMESLDALRHQRVHADRRFAAAVRLWSRCMHTAGFPYATPDDARVSLTPPEPSRPAPSDQEVRLAVAEARCAADSGLGKTAAALDEQYDEELRRQYVTTVRSSVRLQLDALPKARRITADQGTEKPRRTVTSPKETP